MKYTIAVVYMIDDCTRVVGITDMLTLGMY